MAYQLFVPKFDVEECLNEIRECLEKGWTGIGYKTESFEKAWMEYTSLKNALFLNSATAGLYLALEILKTKYNWDDDDEVLTTGLTFVSTNHAIVINGLRPVFVDVDKTLCLSPTDLVNKISDKTKAVIFVGIGGNTGKLNEIEEICYNHNLRLIIDAAHMAGSKFYEKTPGLSADAIVYSFQAVKNLPTADSGMICFKENELDKLARKLVWLGIDKDTYSRNSDGNYKWLYEVDNIGYKYHGNSIMASIALVQLRRLEVDNEHRRQLSKIYDQIFMNYSNKIGLIDYYDNCLSSRHLYQILVENRDQMIEYLNQFEIYPGVHYRNNMEYSIYKQHSTNCPNTEEYTRKLVSLPLHLHLSGDDVKYIASKVVDFLGSNES